MNVHHSFFEWLIKEKTMIRRITAFPRYFSLHAEECKVLVLPMVVPTRNIHAKLDWAEMQRAPRWLVWRGTSRGSR